MLLLLIMMMMLLLLLMIGVVCCVFDVDVVVDYNGITDVIYVVVVDDGVCNVV